MSNICKNIFFCNAENEASYLQLKEFIILYLQIESSEYLDDKLIMDVTFLSDSEFPTIDLDFFISRIDRDDSLYIRVLSYELNESYVSLRTYKNGIWNVRDIKRE